ncbi:TPA: amylovoran biosynthesis protein AmsE, partial [Streptococcus suis]|nr:amylovoran biosynthesis protein AmsE [Streptococcus suis]
MSSELYGISVLMSVYKNENPVFLEEAIESIIHQTRKPDEIVIIEDGPLTV